MSTVKVINEIKTKNLKKIVEMLDKMRLSI